MKSNHRTPIVATNTRWFNPLDVPQHVDVHMGSDPRPIRYTVPPGGEVEIPSRFDRAIHHVHNGVILGGIAPQLVNQSLPEGQHPKLHEALDTQLAEKRANEERLMLADATRRAAEQVQVIAAGRVARAEKRMAEKSESR